MLGGGVSQVIVAASSGEEPNVSIVMKQTCQRHCHFYTESKWIEIKTMATFYVVFVFLSDIVLSKHIVQLALL